MCASFICRQRNSRPYIVSSAKNIVSKCYFCVQIWLVSKECFVIKLAEVSTLSFVINTVCAKKQNLLKSDLNSPGWKKMNVQESFSALILISSPNTKSYISTTVLYTKSYITLGWPVIYLVQTLPVRLHQCPMSLLFHQPRHLPNQYHHLHLSVLHHPSQ